MQLSSRRNCFAKGIPRGLPIVPMRDYPSKPSLPYQNKGLHHSQITERASSSWPARPAGCYSSTCVKIVCFSSSRFSRSSGSHGLRLSSLSSSRQPLAGTDLSIFRATNTLYCRILLTFKLCEHEPRLMSNVLFLLLFDVSHHEIDRRISRACSIITCDEYRFAIKLRSSSNLKSLRIHWLPAFEEHNILVSTQPHLMRQSSRHNHKTITHDIKDSHHEVKHPE